MTMIAGELTIGIVGPYDLVARIMLSGPESAGSPGPEPGWPLPARRLLGWQPAPAQEGLARSVGWHLANPPDDASTDFAADDQALAAAAQA